MGNTCIPVADSFWYMAKPIQYCKVKKYNEIKKKKTRKKWTVVFADLQDLGEFTFVFVAPNVHIIC